MVKCFLENFLGGNQTRHLCSVGAPASAMVPTTHHAMANAMRTGIAQRKALAARPMLCRCVPALA